MIYIITPCSRPENLEQISKTIPQECKWVVVHDNKKPAPNINNATFLVCDDTGIVGTKAQNFALDNLPLNDEDIVYLLDDDNIIHPRWYKTVSNWLNYDFSIMTWGQLYKDGSLRLRPTNMPAPNRIDTACFMIKWKYNKNVRHEYVYHHDGIYAETCSFNGNTLCVDDYLAYYNYLR